MNKTTKTTLSNWIYLIRLNGRFSGGSRLVAPAVLFLQLFRNRILVYTAKR